MLRVRTFSSAKSEVTIKFSGSLPTATPLQNKKVAIELTDQNSIAKINSLTFPNLSSSTPGKFTNRVKVFKKNGLLSKPKQADLSENLETIISENKEQFIMKKSTLVKATMGAVLLLTTGIFSVTNVNSSQAHSANQKLRYGQTYKLVNGYDNWQGGYLDTRGRNCSDNLLCVSTANNPNRDNGSGSWKILSKTGKTGVVESLDDVYLQNQYEQGAGGYLDTRGRNCSENLLCVSTANNPNRDSGSGTWKIISKNKSSDNLREGQPVQLMNGYGNGQGGYLDTRGRSCNENLLCVSTAAGADRDSGSGTWKFIKQ